MQKRLILTLAAGHLFTDVSQGALPALLPFFIVVHHFSYTTAATLVFVANLVSCVMQPAFGHLTDRKSVPWIVPAGIAIAGLGVALTGVVPGYRWMLAAVAVNGLAVAAFHPEAARLVKFLSGDKKATAMSWFAVGGNLGFAVGPLLTTVCVLWFGLKGGLLIAVPGLVLGAVIIGQRSQFSSIAPARNNDVGGRTEHDRWRLFGWLTATTVFRSVVFFGLNTFLALYWISRLHQSQSAGNTALSILLFSGAAGTLIGGSLSDRFGRGRIVVGSLLLLPVLLLMLLATHNVLVATLLLVPLGLLMTANFSPLIVMAQDFLPNHLGVASGVTYGIGASIGGVATPFFGWIADHYGLQTSMSWLLVVGGITAALAVVTVYSETAASREAAMAG
jgi:FSR family fosmidomycin resistance protein-like MFS transporter